jgi:ABC-type spermidine/putrescine transport system permease subunit II
VVVLAPVLLIFWQSFSRRRFSIRRSTSASARTRSSRRSGFLSAVFNSVVIATGMVVIALPPACRSRSC